MVTGLRKESFSNTRIIFMAMITLNPILSPVKHSFVQVDVVYEGEDEGFVSAVNSLVASSKRPVILITNEPHYPHLTRFMDLHIVLKFSAPSCRRMSK